jgi:F-type H+-transporting ATPase subunit alpha
VKKALAFESALHSFIKSKYGALLDKIESDKDIDADTDKALSAAIDEFKATAVY